MIQVIIRAIHSKEIIHILSHLIPHNYLVPWDCSQHCTDESM